MLDTNIMENEDHSHLKVPLIIFGSLFVIIFLVILFVAVSRSSSKKEAAGNVVNEKEAKAKGNTSFSNQNEPSPTPITISNLASYDTLVFKIKHPDNWGVFYYSYNGGEEYTIKPYDLEKNQIVPSVQIEVNVASDSALIDERRDLFKRAKFLEEVVVFQGVQSIKESGVFPIRDSGEKNPYFQTAYLFQKNNKTYIVKYSYDGGQKNQVTENAFGKILETLIIN